jgi:hypothetical protein
VTRAEQEITAPIKRDELLALLDAMAASAPPPSAGLFNNVDWDELMSAAMTAMARRPKPIALPVRASGSWPSTRTRTFSQMAALLPPCEPVRFPRASRPPPVVRAKTPTEKRAAQTVAEARARLDTAEETTDERAASRERVSFPVLSSTQSAGEELAMLPMRLSLPKVPAWETPPRMEITAVEDDAVLIHSPRSTEHERSSEINARDSTSFATAIASFAALLAMGVCAGYFLF